MRWVGGVVVGVLVAGNARADVNEQCAADRARGSALHDKRELRSAMYAFRACSAEECADAVRAECAASYDAVAAEMPSVVVVVRDARGSAIDGAHVFVDGREPQRRGSAILVDPGEHDVRVDGIDGVEQHVVVRDGDRKHLVFVSSTPDPRAHAQHSTWPWVVTASGGAGVVTGAALTIASLVMWADVSTACSTYTTACGDKQQEGHDARALNYTGIGLVIGGATVAAVGLLWHFLEPSHATTLAFMRGTTFVF